MKKWTVLAWIFSCTATFSSFANSIEMKERMKTDFQIIHNIFQTKYAPIHWKKEQIGWDLSEQMAIAMAKIDSNQVLELKDYHRILKEFFDGLHDYHTSIDFHRTESAVLPFQLRSVNQRYFITGIDRKSLPPELRALQIGDEVLQFDGIPIDSAVKKFREEEFGQCINDTERAFAEIFFTVRAASQGCSIPKGAASFKICHKRTARIKEYVMDWLYSEEEITNPLPTIFSKPLEAFKEKDPLLKSPFKSSYLQDRFFAKSMLAPLDKMVGVFPALSLGHGLGAKKSFVPALGRIIWETDEEAPFYAYLFETKGRKRIGYLRIPSYKGNQDEIEFFKDIVEKFERKSDALVIDQVNNLGGLVFYMYAMASILADKPLEMAKHRISLTQQEVAFAIDCIRELEMVQSEKEAQEVVGYSIQGFPITFSTAQKMLDYFREIVNEWNLGHTLTKPLHLWGIDAIDPDPFIHYTKPILILINELDLSCGDFFPALMQDNRRALLFGSATGGAGGFVLETEYPNLFGVNRVFYTGSLAERSTGICIENRGVQPDIAYALKEEDLINGYKLYGNSILEAIDSLFFKSP